MDQCAQGEGAALPEAVPPTLAAALARHARLRPEAPAIVALGRRPLSYRDLARRVADIGASLDHAGMGRRSRIGIVLPSGPDAVLWNIAVACHAIAVPFHPDSTLAEFEERAAVLRLDAVVVRDKEQTPALPPLAVPVFETMVESGFGRSLATRPRRAPRAVVEARPSDIALIAVTSGTTARPKLVPATHGNLAAMAAKMQRWFGLSPADRGLCVMPLHYGQGLKQGVFASLLLGGSIACVDGAPVPDDFFDRLCDLAPTWFTAGPTHHRRILELANMRPGAPHALRYVHTAGAPLPAPERRALEDALGVPVLGGYGLSEAGLIVSNALPPGRRKPGTVGVAAPDEVTIAGADGTRCDVGETGEILLRGPSIMPGYLDDAAADREAFVGDGWFRTGDLGAVDADGFLTVEGRVNELINRGGEKISPAEIEEALLRHPAVVEAAAFAVPHPRLGEDVAAAVVPRAGAATTAAQLQRFLRSELAPFKIPRRILILGRLPKGDTGKVQRARLQERLVSAVTPPTSTGSDGARGRLEVEFAELWRELLNSEVVGFDDDFFDKGGDSLLATELLLAIEKMTGRPLPDTVLFEAPTIRELARIIESAEPLAARPLVALQTGGHAPPLFFFHGEFVHGGYYARRLPVFSGRGSRSWP